MKQKIVICHKNNADAEHLVSTNQEYGKTVYEDEAGFYYVLFSDNIPVVKSKFGDGWASAWVENEL